jgi:hypothetical protein
MNLVAFFETNLVPQVKEAVVKLNDSNQTKDLLVDSFSLKKELSEQEIAQQCISKFNSLQETAKERGSMLDDLRRTASLSKGTIIEGQNCKSY